MQLHPAGRLVLVAWFLVATGASRGGPAVENGSLAGRVLRAGDGTPVRGTQLSFFDLVAGALLAGVGAQTASNGEYAVALAPGIYEVRFQPPPPAGAQPRLAPQWRREVSVLAGATVRLADTLLLEGHRLTGLVHAAPAVPLPGAAVAVHGAGGDLAQYPLVATATLAGGAFEVVVPDGTYDVRIDPPAGGTSASAVARGIVVAGDVDLGTTVLDSGVVVSGEVVDMRAVPWPGVRVRARDQGGHEQPTLSDLTNGTGSFAVRVPVGSWDLQFDPVTNALLEPRLVGDVSATRPVDLGTIVLADHNADTDAIVDLFDDCVFQSDPVQEDLDADDVGSLCDNCPLFSNPRQQNNDGQGGGDACDFDDDNDGVPDFSDADRDGDLLPNTADNCPNARNAAQHDLDGDGQGDACDADDGEVEFLQAVETGGFRMRPESAAVATAYTVYRQRLGWLSPIDYGTCAHAGPPAAVFHDPEVPPPGEGFAYVAAAVTPLGEGSLGRTSSGEVRPNLRPCLQPTAAQQF